MAAVAVLMARIRSAVTAKVFAAADTVALRMEAKAVQAAPKSLGQLAARIHGRAIQEGSLIRARLECDSPYGRYVEEGTGPAVGHQRYMPPPGALRLWVQRTLRPPAVKGDEARVIEAVERAVRWAIYLRGTRPQPFMGPAAEAGRAIWRRELVAGVKAGVREASRGAR
jgi:hypothetical protein